MGLITKLQLLIRSAKPAGQFVDQIKGARLKYKTIPFWLTLVTTLISFVGALKGIIPATAAVIAIAVCNAIYNILRGLDKANQEGIKPALKSTEFWVGMLGIIATSLTEIQTAGVNSEVLTSAITLIGAAMGIAQNIGAQQPQDVKKLN